MRFKRFFLNLVGNVAIQLGGISASIHFSVSFVFWILVSVSSKLFLSSFLILSLLSTNFSSYSMLSPSQLLLYCYEAQMVLI